MEFLGKIVNLVWSLAASILGSALGLGFVVPSALLTIDSVRKFDFHSPALAFTIVRPLDGILAFANLFHWQWLHDNVQVVIAYQATLGVQAVNILWACSAIVFMVSFGLVIGRRLTDRFEAIWAESAAWIGLASSAQLGKENVWATILIILGILLLATVLIAAFARIAIEGVASRGWLLDSWLWRWSPGSS